VWSLSGVFLLGSGGRRFFCPLAHPTDTYIVHNLYIKFKGILQNP